MWPLILVLILILGLMAPRIVYEVDIFRRARFDLRNSRGTIHKKLVKKGLVKLNLKITEAESKIQQLNLQKTNLALEERREVERTLSSIIVNTELDDVPGIGPILKERIIRYCFDGTLESLRRASNVHGIGEEKYRAILQWVNNKRYSMPRLLTKDFPGKHDIIRRYSESETRLVEELEKVGDELSRARLDASDNGVSKGAIHTYYLSDVQTNHQVLATFSISLVFYAIVVVLIAVATVVIITSIVLIKRSAR